MATSIRLNRRNKTIKVVNRKENIKLSNPKENIKLKHTGKKGPAGTVDVGTTTTLAEGNPASVTNSGTSQSAILDFAIPKGDKGDTGVSTFVREHHAADDSVARPSALYVEWVGSVEPLNATEEDTWIDTA